MKNKTPNITIIQNKNLSGKKKFKKREIKSNKKNPYNKSKLKISTLFVFINLLKKGFLCLKKKKS